MRTNTTWPKWSFFFFKLQAFAVWKLHCHVDLNLIVQPYFPLIVFFVCVFQLTLNLLLLCSNVHKSTSYYFLMQEASVLLKWHRRDVVWLQPSQQHEMISPAWRDKYNLPLCVCFCSMSCHAPRFLTKLATLSLFTYTSCFLCGFFFSGHLFPRTCTNTEMLCQRGFSMQ